MAESGAKTNLSEFTANQFIESLKSILCQQKSPYFYDLHFDTNLTNMSSFILYRISVSTEK